jgi:hypothetical protein
VRELHFGSYSLDSENPTSSTTTTLVPQTLGPKHAGDNGKTHTRMPFIYRPDSSACGQLVSKIIVGLVVLKACMLYTVL